MDTEDLAKLIAEKKPTCCICQATMTMPAHYIKGKRGGERFYHQQCFFDEVIATINAKQLPNK